ncbi:MAG: Gfo/Idh/MocA family oxidoreductase [Clostridiales bacterium]|nr:Gfo/Idh/MocA family oxidoreductase [Clostridiales bacterium]
MNHINLGIIGAGIIAHNHVEAAINTPGVKLLCIADIVSQKAESLAEKYNIKPYTNNREMLDNESLDAVIITLPVFLHCESVVEAANRGLHILVEKPMASTVEECNLMISEAKKNNVKLMVGHIQRYISSNMRAFEMIQEGTLGGLIMINERRYYNYFNDRRPAWCLKKETAGGGVIMNLGAHSIDKVLYMSQSRIKKVHGKVGFFATGTDVEGNGQLLLEMENGVSAVTTHYGYSKVAEYTTEYIFHDGIIKTTTNNIITIQAGDKRYDEELLKIDPFKLQLEDFIKSIEEDKTPAISGEYGLEVIQAITSVY